MMTRLERLLRDRDLDPGAVLGAASRAEGLGADARVPYAAVEDAIERSCQRLGADGFGLALASVRHDEAYGLAGLLLVTSDNLRQGLRRAFAYQRLWGDGERFTLREDRDSLTVAFRHPGASVLAGAVLAECALAEVLASARELVQRDATPRCVRFAHAPIGSGAALARHFGVAARFQQTENAIVLDAALVDRPLALRRDLLRTAFERQCREALSRLPSQWSVAERVRRALEELVDTSMPISKLAARLHMSARTLQRELKADGTTFQELVDAARRVRAADLLRAGSSHKEVALHLGYSDPSGFLRARRRWRTPRGA